MRNYSQWKCPLCGFASTQKYSALDHFCSMQYVILIVLAKNDANVSYATAQASFSTNASTR